MIIAAIAPPMAPHTAGFTDAGTFIVNLPSIVAGFFWNTEIVCLWKTCGFRGVAGQV
jgi:hypothetical protein